MIFARKAPYFLKKLPLIRRIPLMSFSSDCTSLDAWSNVLNKGSCLVELSVGSRRFSGSGVVLHDRGLVVTTSNIILRQYLDGLIVDRHFCIRMPGSYVCEGRLVGYDASSMVAFVTFKPIALLKAVSVGLSRVMKPGDQVAFMSSSCPSIGSGSVTAGCIGSTSCDLRKKKLLSFKGRMPDQISGQGLFNVVGELIGLGMPQHFSRKVSVMPIDIVWKILDIIIVHVLKEKVLPVLFNAESWEMRQCKRDPKWLTSVDHVKLEKKFRYLIHVCDGLSASDDLESSIKQVKCEEGAETNGIVLMHGLCKGAEILKEHVVGNSSAREKSADANSTKINLKSQTPTTLE